MDSDTEFIRILGSASDQDAAEIPAPKPPPKALPSSLPVLGLSDIVIFPGMVAPLLVDTAQSIRLIDDVVEGTACSRSCSKRSRMSRCRSRMTCINTVAVRAC